MVVPFQFELHFYAEKLCKCYGMVDLSRPITKNSLNNTILFAKNYITVSFEDFGIIRKFLITCLQQQHSLEEINHR